MNRIWKYLLFFIEEVNSERIYMVISMHLTCTHINTYIQTNTVRKDFQGFSVLYCLRITWKLPELAEVSCNIFIVRV